MSREFRLHERPGLYCIELRTSQWEACVAWYREALGLRVLVRVVDDGYALIEAGETRLALLARSQSDEPSGRFSLAFEVSDLRATIVRLETAGSIVKHPLSDPEGLREIYTTDPDGNRVRIFCWPERQ